MVQIIHATAKKFLVDERLCQNKSRAAVSVEEIENYVKQLKGNYKTCQHLTS